MSPMLKFGKADATADWGDVRMRTASPAACRVGEAGRAPGAPSCRPRPALHFKEKLFSIEIFATLLFRRVLDRQTPA